MSVLDRFRHEGRIAMLTGVGEHEAKTYAEFVAHVVISACTQDRLDRIVGETFAEAGQIGTIS